MYDFFPGRKWKTVFSPLCFFRSTYLNYKRNLILYAHKIQRRMHSFKKRLVQLDRQQKTLSDDVAFFKSILFRRVVICISASTHDCPYFFLPKTHILSKNGNWISAHKWEYCYTFTMSNTREYSFSIEPFQNNMLHSITFTFYLYPFFPTTFYLFMCFLVIWLRDYAVRLYFILVGLLGSRPKS